MFHDPTHVVHMGEAVDSSRAVAIMVHGRGAGPHNILELVPVIDRPGVAYLAPAAEGHTWYPHSFLSDISDNEPHLTSALQVLATIVRQTISRGVPRERIVLLGFSQGACLAGEFAVRHAARYGGLVMFSGGLIGPPGTRWDHPGAFGGMPVFLGCSDVDPHIPKERVDETARVFARMGAEVSKRIYPGMGHLVIMDELRAAGDILDRALADANDGRPQY